jgi:hypothetical protein
MLNASEIQRHFHLFPKEIYNIRIDDNEWNKTVEYFKMSPVDFLFLKNLFEVPLIPYGLMQSYTRSMALDNDLNLPYLDMQAAQGNLGVRAIWNYPNK